MASYGRGYLPLYAEPGMVLQAYCIVGDMARVLRNAEGGKDSCCKHTAVQAATQFLVLLME
jgi:hypothetical protein